MCLISLGDYLSGTMKNGCWGVSIAELGHQRSFKVIALGQVAKKE